MFKKIFTAIAVIIISGLMWYLAFGLDGTLGWLLFIAPVPVMIFSVYSIGRLTFFVSFAAYLIGRLSWLSYLSSILPVVPVVIFTLMLPLVFALVMTASRRVILQNKRWWTVFAFPVLWTTFEFLFCSFSSDGTAGSIAYHFFNLLSIIQVASITGIWGITFFAAFIPSAISLAWYFHRNIRELNFLSVVSICIAVSLFLFGELRLYGSTWNDISVPAGLAVIDEKLHFVTNKPDSLKEIQSAKLYAEKISLLSKQGAHLILMPERAVNITPETEHVITNIFSNCAKSNHVSIISGFTNFKKNLMYNSAFVITPEGNMAGIYNKAKLIKGLEGMFTPGKETGIFNADGINAGVAICKDMDFPSYIKKFSESKINLLCVPAWDFVKDDWLHSRMAIMRGVENGISIARCARLGRLTISDYTGRVRFETSSTNEKSIWLKGDVVLDRADTFYSRFGDWFAYMNIAGAVMFGYLIWRRGGKRMMNKPHAAG